MIPSVAYGDWLVPLSNGPRWHSATVLPDGSNDIRKIRNTCLPSIALELTARLELRCNTAESPAIARLPPICSMRQ